MADRVFQLQQGKIRDQDISPELMALLETVGNELDVYFEVHSGGQSPKGSGGKRTGSTRHDHGKAADVKAYTLQDGQKRYLDFSKSKDRDLWSDIVRLAVAGGATGIGAGSDYMGNQTVHIGYGNKGTWGAGGRSANAPEWLTAAYKSGTLTPPLNIPDVASLTDTRSAFAPTPARKSSALEAITGATGGKVAAAPTIPSNYDSPRTPQQVAALYEGILPRDGAQSRPRLPTLFGDIVGVPDNMIPLSDATYSGANRMSVGGIGSLLGGRTIPPAAPNPVPQLPSVGGVGGANIAGQVQLPRNVVPQSVQRDMAAITGDMPPWRTSPIGTFPSALDLDAMRGFPRSPVPMPPIMRSPVPASFSQMQMARAPMPMPRRSVAPIPMAPLMRAPQPMPRPMALYEPRTEGNHPSAMPTAYSLV
jgi:hypothetical protein